MEGRGAAREGVLTLLLMPPSFAMAFPGVKGCTRGLCGVRFIITRRLTIPPRNPLTSCRGLDDRFSVMAWTFGWLSGGASRAGATAALMPTVPSDNDGASLDTSGNTSSASMVSSLVMLKVELSSAGLPSNSLRTTWGPEAQVEVVGTVEECTGATWGKVVPSAFLGLHWWAAERMWCSLLSL